MFRLFENEDIDRESVVKRLKIARLFSWITFRTSAALVEMLSLELATRHTEILAEG